MSDMEHISQPVSRVIAKLKDTTPVQSNSTLRGAICCVMADLQRLKKADRNKFANYDFTSVDDFKDEVRPLMAKHGLTVHVTQAGVKITELDDDKGKKKQFAQFDFLMTLEHVCGEKRQPEAMSVFLGMTGAQTSGAARSYAVKEWMKSAFLASSGDMQEEADLMDGSRSGLRMSKADARPMYTALEKELAEVATGRDKDAVAQWWKDAKERLDLLPQDWFLTIKQSYADTYRALKAGEDLDRAMHGAISGNDYQDAAE